MAIIAKYEEARQIIKELLCIGYDIHSLEIHDDLWENYESEYVVSLYDNSVWCEPMLREKGYIDEDAPIIYVLDNCSSKVIPYCKGKTVYEVTVGEEETDDEEGYAINGETVNKEKFDEYVSQFKAEDNKVCNYGECECTCKKDEKPTTAKRSQYFINGKSVDKSEFDKKYDEFEDRFFDSIRDMLLYHCDLMDEINDIRSKIMRW